MRLRTMAVAAASMAMIVSACGDDDDDSGGSVAAYCGLVAELDEAGEEIFAPLEEDESATEEDFARAEQEFVEAHEDDFEELRRVAPEEIAADVETLVDAQLERAAGGEQEESSDAVIEAEERVQSFEEQNC